MLRFLGSLAAFTVALLIVIALLAGIQHINKPMTQFQIDTQQWSCSQTSDGRVLSCVKHGSV